MTALTEVRVRDCACPGSFHNGTGDIVYLRSKPSLELGLSVQADIIRTAGSPIALLKRAWAVSYIREGVVGWNFVDEQGKERPLDHQELLDDFDVAMVICEKADELYGDRVVSPLLATMFPDSLGTSPTSSPTGPTADSTSPNRASRRRRSRPSSDGTTAGSR